LQESSNEEKYMIDKHENKLIFDKILNEIKQLQ